MKNLKKVLSLVLALSMVLSTFTVAFADTDTETNASTLYDLGLFDGMSDEEYVPNLEGTATREQAMKMIAVALDWELDMDAVSQFADVSDWAQPYVAKAVEMGVTNGFSEEAFGATELVTARQLETFYDRIITGSTTAWDDNAGLDNEVAVTRGYLVDVTYAALMQTAVGETTTLIEAIVADDADLAEIAEEAGLIVAEDVAIGVKSVTTNGLRQIVIEFTDALDDAGDEDNYSLDDESEDAEIDSDADFDLSDDGMTVTITMETAADQQETATLEIEDLLTEDVEVEIEFVDTTIPTVTAAEAVGVDTIKVYFSESMNDVDDDGNDDYLLEEDNYEVYDADGDEIGISDVTAASDNTYALVEIQDDLEDDVTIVVDDVEDYAGLAVLETELSVAVTVDDDAPEVIGYDDTSIYEVTLIFDNDIEFEDDDLDNFYHTNDDNTADSVEIDGDELTITFDADNELPEGTAYIYIEDGSINDLWDNENDDIKVSVEIDSDDDAPEVDDDLDVDVDDGETEIVVYFDEDIFEDDDLEITLYDEDGDDAEIGYEDDANDLDDYLDGDIDDDDLTDELTIVFDEELSGDYTLEIEGLVDVYDNEVDTISIDFTVDDEIDPDPSDFTATLYDEDEDEQLLVVDFGEAMDEDLVTDLSYYEFDGYTLDDIDDDYIEIDLVDDDSVVEITLDTDNEEADDAAFEFVSTEDLEIGYLADAEGNYMTEYSYELTIIDGDSETIDIDSGNIELTDSETIEIYVEDEDGIGYELDDVDEDDFVFFLVADTDDTAEANRTYLSVDDVDVDTDDDDITTITFTLDTDDDDYEANEDYFTSTHEGTTAGALMYEILDDDDDDDDAAGTTEYGQTLTAVVGQVSDDCAPEMIGVYYTNLTVDNDGDVIDDIEQDDIYNAILIEFSEDLDPDAFSTGDKDNGFSVSGGDADLDYAELYTTLGDNWVVLYSDLGDDEDDLDEDGDDEDDHIANFTEDTNVYYDDSAELEDTSSEDLEDFSETDELDALSDY